MLSIKLKNIPQILLPVITSTRAATLWLNGNKVDEIYIFKRNQFRINTNRGQFRYSLDTDLELDIS